MAMTVTAKSVPKSVEIVHQYHAGPTVILGSYLNGPLLEMEGDWSLSEGDGREKENDDNVATKS